jgi:hypothetical protein
MDKQVYHCAANLRLRARMLLNEMGRWHEWAADVEDTALIERLEGCLRAMHQKKVAVCLEHERRPGDNGWDNNYSDSGAGCLRKSDDYRIEGRQ